MKDVLFSVVFIVAGIGAFWLPHSGITIYYPKSRTPMPKGEALLTTTICGLTWLVVGFVSLWHTLHAR